MSLGKKSGVGALRFCQNSDH